MYEWMKKIKKTSRHLNEFKVEKLHGKIKNKTNAKENKNKDWMK